MRACAESILMAFIDMAVGGIAGDGQQQPAPYQAAVPGTLEPSAVVAPVPRRVHQLAQLDLVSFDFVFLQVRAPHLV